jgi:regulator of RNase E activity RraB
MNKQYIETLLDDGMTPEQIYQQALRIAEAKKATTEKIAAEKNKAADNVVNALSKYLEIMCGVPVNDKEKAEIKAYMNELEGIVKVALPTATKEKSNKGADQALADFLKSMGF